MRSFVIKKLLPLAFGLICGLTFGFVAQRLSDPKSPADAIRKAHILDQHCATERRRLGELDYRLAHATAYPPQTTSEAFGALAFDDFESVRVCIVRGEQDFPFDTCGLGRGEVSCMRETIAVALLKTDP